ncbi:ABC transporter substrate-binding protein [Streptosporangium sp. NPDC000396]|uniref:ABC transporter substrate-binding protein n=1 Tax=Streptosporangium sp. NPDC000396 TaxID=3366185 RepID=UPI0036A4FDA4
MTVLAVTAAGCSASGSGQGSKSPGAAYEISKDTPQAKGPVPSLTWSLFAEPQSLDYVYAYDYPPNTVLANICEQLLRITPDMKIEPGLATKFANPDPRTWVYTIREGVSFHDGTPLTAADVVASLRRHMDSKIGSYWATAFRDVKSIDKTGPMEVTIRLSKPNALVNQLLAASPGTIESAAFLKKAGRDYGSPKGGVNCTGPFSMQQWSQGDSITLKKNDRYWDTALTPKADTLKVVFIQDPAARVNAMLSGSVDGGYMLPTNSYARLRSNPAGKLYFGPNTTASSLIVTNLKGTLGDLKVRQALSLALDREGIIKAAAGGAGVPAKAPAATGAWATVPDKTAGYYAKLPALTRDVEAAKKLIGEAGAKGKKVVMATSSLGPEISVVANAVQAAGKEIGLDVELKSVAPDAYSALFSDPGARQGLDLMITNWYNNTPDPLEFYANLLTGEFANYGGYSNPEYDAIVERALQTADPAARADVTAQLQEIAVRDLPWIPLYEMPHTMFLNQRITGAPTSITQLYWPWAATIGSAG